MKRFVFIAVCAVFLVFAVAGFCHAAEVTTTWGYGGVDYNWGTGGNWDLGVPQNGVDQYIAVINDADTIAVDSAYVVNALNNYAGILDIANYKSLTLTTGTSINNGVIRLNDTGSGAAVLYVDGTVTLGGTGSVEFFTGDQNYIYNSGGGTLTVGADQTIHTGSGAAGTVNMAVTNQGKISADGGTIALTTMAKENQGTIEAVNTGILNIVDITVDNTAGTLSVDDTSTINLSGATIQGGISGTGNVNVSATSYIDGTGTGGSVL
ncbi:MAG: hypothetical protein SVS15_04085, partial [Thermodesulfobacteriota bacterium]|nr:hypothetical protein [Thermodesulfobacteriota bacterium]